MFGLVAAATIAVAGAASLGARQEEPFPHEDHQGLFPVCSGCHADVTSADRADRYPAAEQCSGCHDGVNQDEVVWAAPSERVSNVVFDHGAHASDLAAAGDAPVACESCHSDPQGGRMSVDAAEELESCWGCHAHERDDHYAGTPAASAEAALCTSCHVPLASSGFDRPRLEVLPEPDDHVSGDFLLEAHAVDAAADVARCATCHTSDRCVACHVDAGLAEIRAIPAAPPEMAQPEWGHEYPTPETHTVRGFDQAHPVGPDGAADCSSCHTTDDCLSCHIEPAPEPIGRLPTRAVAVAPGAYLDVEAPESHLTAFFMDAHANLAAAGPSTCASCHTETYCAECHDGPSDGGYHPPSFVARHAGDAYGRAEECASCHSTAAFCRECHESGGLGSAGRLGAGYHDAEPLWLLRHGGPARQSLESCASCHRQTDCVQCHGVLGSFQVSPHTDDFDAERAWARSPRTCMACHVSNPTGGG